MILDSDATNDSSEHNLVSNHWLVGYKYYLFAAVTLSTIALGRTLMQLPGQLSSIRNLPPEIASERNILMFVSLGVGVAKIGLFVFAIYSLKRLSETWVRKLHLSINGAAVIVVILGSVLTIIGPGSMSWYLSIANRVASVVVFPLWALIPWNFLYQISRTVGQLFSWSMSLTVLAFAAVWWSRWLVSDLANSHQHAVHQTEAADTNSEVRAIEFGSDNNVSEPSQKSKVFHAIGWILVVISAPVIVILPLMVLGDVMAEMGKAFNALGSTAESVPFWGGLAFVFGGGLVGAIGGVVLVLLVMLFFVAIAVFGVGMIAIAYSDVPENRGRGMMISRRIGFVFLFSPLGALGLILIANII